MRVMICGPVGNKGPKEIEKMEHFLQENGFDIVGQYGMGRENYSTISDFRSRQKLSRKIVHDDLKFVRKADVVVILPTPSFGASIEMFVGKKLGKKIILFSSKPMPSPWPVYFSDFVAINKRSLLEILHQIEKKSIKN